MSALLLSKLDIDVLVQLAWLGPSDAADWKPLTADPDGLGELLWNRNYEWAGDPAEPPKPQYRFEPLPIVVTATEGLKHLFYYRYQTEDDEGRWRRDGVGTLLDWLQESLVHALPGFDEAPWRWSADDLVRRAGRRRPVVPGQPPEPEIDPRCQAVVTTFDTIGMPLTQRDPAQEELQVLRDPRYLLCAWSHRPPEQIGLLPVGVVLGRDDETAHDLFLANRMRYQELAALNDVQVLRFGSTVVYTVFLLGAGLEDRHRIEVHEKLKLLGRPDERWSSQDPVSVDLTAEVVGTHVRLASDVAGTHPGTDVFVARTPETLTKLATIVQDDDVRRQLLATDHQRKSVVMMRGFSEVERVTSASMVEIVSDDGGPAVGQELYLRTEGATSAVATLLAVDRLPEDPSRVTLIDPGLNARFLVRKL